MASIETAVQRPQRWDSPFSTAMTDTDVERLLALPPFSAINADAFSRKLPLRGILKNDCRINRYRAGDVVMQVGDYGGSAFLILTGSAIVSLAPLPAEFAAQKTAPRKPLSQIIKSVFTKRAVAEVRTSPSSAGLETHSRVVDETQRLFVQDIPGTIDMTQTKKLVAGELFGELAALSRTPRTATVIAETDGEMLEIRWQGLRDIMRRDSVLKQHIDSLYRQHSLYGHLHATPILNELPVAILEQLVAETEFETYGEFEWNQPYRAASRKDIAKRIDDEPVIAEEGQPAESLYLIRNGFARLSRRYGDGHQTVAYLGKGQMFGLREMAHNWNRDHHRPWTLTLRAVGYVDILRIPQLAVEQLVLPNLPESCLPAPLPVETESVTPAKRPDHDRRASRRDGQLATGLLEFLVEGRLINGSQAMVIDLDRCTRCDDCVRACADTHDNNPRFVRQGPVHDKWMFASACMHCLDPVCMIGCPTGAIGREATSGNVVVNDGICIGCGTCANSCPYSNIRMVDIHAPDGSPWVDEKKGDPIQKATKCDFCEGLPHGPACQRACPHDALTRVDLTSPLTLYQLDQAH